MVRETPSTRAVRLTERPQRSNSAHTSSPALRCSAEAAGAAAPACRDGSCASTSASPIRPPATQGSEVAAGRQKAQMRVACHGPLGLSTAPDAPHLAGQPAIYVAAQLRAYRSGASRHEVMAMIARPLSDDEIAQAIRPAAEEGERRSGVIGATLEATRQGLWFNSSREVERLVRRRPVV